MDEPIRHPFGFHGNAREYFGIWVVNILLSVLTLGVYSAWAKVRTARYFHGNTRVAGSAFDYTADPKRILAGRIIAVGLLVAYQVMYLPYPNVAVLLLAAAAPFVLMTSIAFRMRYTLWRGINFSFARNTRGAYLLFAPFLVWLGMVTLLPVWMGVDFDYVPLPDPDPDADPDADAGREGAGLITPFGLRMAGLLAAGALLAPLWLGFYYNFVANRIHYGRSAFRLRFPTGRLYLTAFVALLILLGLFFALTTAFTHTMPAFVNMEDDPDIVALGIYTAVGVTLSFSLSWLTAIAWFQTGRTNALYSAIKMPGVAFQCRLEFPMMAYLYITNTFAIVFTIGLAIPWAKVRTARYRAERMSLTAESVDDFVAANRGEVDAGADAVADLFDLDLGL